MCLHIKGFRVFFEVLFIVLLLIFASLLTLVILNLRFNDMSVPDMELPSKGNILIIFPHPDDELAMCGGLINKLSKFKRVKMHVISTTRGEHGDELLKLPPDALGQIRTDEFAKVMHILGSKNFEVWDFIDGKMRYQKLKIKKMIEEYIKDHKIGMVITYERFGVYGHPDHIILSKIVYELSQEMNFKTLYATLPNKILKKIKLPKTLTYGDKVIPLTIDGIADPEFKLNITQNLPKRYYSCTKYKSQNFSQGRPLWLVNLFANYEYYTTKYE